MEYSAETAQKPRNQFLFLIFSGHMAFLFTGFKISNYDFQALGNGTQSLYPVISLATQQVTLIHSIVTLDKLH